MHNHLDPMPAFSRLFAATVLAICVAPAMAANSHDEFMANWKSLCGQRFEGAMTYPIDPKHDFAGKLLVAQASSCSDTEIRVPLHVGEDRSRTWIITRTATGLYLRHDHRHADGTPDVQTVYGGPTNEQGSSMAQSFFADTYTAELIKGAVTNIWTITLSPDRNTLTYHLERDRKPRVTVVFKRATP